ncbi:MAG: class I SAM-dependent methyltransferase [Hyphomicrobiales bacterium]
MNVQTAISTPDYEAIKIKQNAAWSSGDYSVVGTTIQIVGETLAETMDPVPGSRILDVAAGNGNATLAFARRWHAVTSTDYVSGLLEKGKNRAEAEGQNVTFQVADAEALPFDDGSFDAVVSTFGVMFTPNQTKAASELVRTCRSGGQIGMANWTPSSFIGQLFKTLGSHVAPPAGVKSPALWGDETWLRDNFSEAADISITHRNFVFRYRSPEHFIDVFRNLYGPVHKAFLALDDAGQAALNADIIALIESLNEATDGTMAVPAEYAEVVITKA